MTENDFIGKYNFSRRMVNHRVPYDFNYAKEMSFWNSNWRINMKNNLIGQYFINFKKDWLKIQDYGIGLPLWQLV